MLSQDATRYLELHRAMGFKFRIQGSLLRNFVAFAEPRGDEFVRTQSVLHWAAQAPSPPQRRNRLLTVRRFALAMQAEDERHQIPPADALGRESFKRCTPYIYSLPSELGVGESGLVGILCWGDCDVIPLRHTQEAQHESILQHVQSNPQAISAH